MIEEIPEFETHKEFFDWACGRDDVDIILDNDCMWGCISWFDDEYQEDCRESVYDFNDENPEVVLMWLLNNKMKINTEWC